MGPFQGSWLLFMAACELCSAVLSQVPRTQQPFTRTELRLLPYLHLSHQTADAFTVQPVFDNMWSRWYTTGNEGCTLPTMNTQPGLWQPCYCLSGSVWVPRHGSWQVCKPYCCRRESPEVGVASGRAPEHQCNHVPSPTGHLHL